MKRDAIVPAVTDSPLSNLAHFGFLTLPNFSQLTQSTPASARTISVARALVVGANVSTDAPIRPAVPTTAGTRLRFTLFPRWRLGGPGPQAGIAAS